MTCEYDPFCSGLSERCFGCIPQVWTGAVIRNNRCAAPLGCAGLCLSAMCVYVVLSDIARTSQTYEAVTMSDMDLRCATLWIGWRKDSRVKYTHLRSMSDIVTASYVCDVREMSDKTT